MNPSNENKGRTYVAIDLKSFYASVECVERGLDPLDTCLVVADESRTQKTICLAVSPALKAYGTGGRPRLFEVIQRVRDVNLHRGRKAKSISRRSLDSDPDLEIDYLVALPRMALYIEYSKKIYEIYLRLIAPEDIHVYSIDEVFLDITDYLPLYGMTAHEFTIRIIKTVLQETGITATAGIGTNLYLSKIAMDIVAKRMPADEDGVRIAELDEMSYRKQLWDHTPLTDFWRVGRGIVKRLAVYGLNTMGDIARCSISREDLLYKVLGVNAELLIDHAWGREPVTLKEVKSYQPESKSISSGQVLQRPYQSFETRNVVLEMADAVAFDLMDKNLLTDQMVLTIGYDVESLKDGRISMNYKGNVKKDWYGREVPQHAHGTINFDKPTNSGSLLIEKAGELFDRIINPTLLARRITLCLNHLKTKNKKNTHKQYELDLFTDPEEWAQKIKKIEEKELKDAKQQKAMLEIKKKFGNNSILRGLNFAEGTTQRERNNQIGGHKK